MRAYRPIADRRRQLIDTGLAIGEREGVAAVTARRVASEAGVSLGLVSYCFATKDDLTVAMAARIAEDTAEAADRPFEPSPPDQVDSLEPALLAALKRLWDLHEAAPGRQLLTYEITTRALREPRLNDVAQQQYDSTVGSCGRVLQHVADLVGVTWDRDVYEVASVAVMAIDGATLRWLVDKDSDAALRRLGDVARLLSTMAH
ncbi:TetR/AcrR family transcriptional regulator [Kineosporia succinea]|uniref:AcrR family transcriptional regulator n=1 Tax=Kineosporia succinea TaxID=84632 RepID=A0ABT9P2F8_9ACTN|nr:TetR family transcriptional regulator [Kineosporia succinea]MDP9826868.1 AcrR family transcriptional regulator [Kineosporia succinea]